MNWLFSNIGNLIINILNVTTTFNVFSLLWVILSFTFLFKILRYALSI